MKIKTFFETDYQDYASYDNYRNICSFIDGLKPSARKSVYTVLDKNINAPKKVSQIKAIVSEHTEYIHGDDSLAGVIINLAQNFVGSNNVPLFKRKGHFGKRVKPVPSADRYIKSCYEDYLKKIFRPEDFPVLIEQEFEGTIIEPRFFVPILPLQYINGSQGMGNGYAHKFYPRNVSDIVSTIVKILDGVQPRKFPTPHYNGYSGVIEENENGGYRFKGVVKKKSNTQLLITELPLGYTGYNDKEKYIAVLDKLEEDKVITGYQDLTDPKKDKYCFLVKCKLAFTKGKTDDELLDSLKLIKNDSEILYAMDQQNKVIPFETNLDILNNFIDIRLEYYEKRRKYLIEKIIRELLILQNKLIFIREIIKKNIKINNLPKSKIIDQLEKFEVKNAKGEVTKTGFDLIDDSYDYLLRMPIYSLSKEKMTELLQVFKDKKKEKKELENKDVKEWYKEELMEFVKEYKKYLKASK